MFLYAVLARAQQQKREASKMRKPTALEEKGSFAVKTQHGGQFKPHLILPTAFTVHIVPRGHIEEEQQRACFFSSQLYRRHHGKGRLKVL